MTIVLNIVIILLVLLIAYWWANQGLFSAILHLLCVVVAGAVALAVWEPLTTGLLLRGNAFDDYAWGISLTGVFIITLLILRVTMDKTIPANVALPSWANLTFGFIVGAAAGILTMGMFIIGAGHIPAGKEIMGFQGAARSDRGGKVEELARLWAPVHEWTYDFYGWLSVTSLYPTFNDTPLRHLAPDLHLQAVSLLRDSALDGRGKFSLMPDAATIDRVMWSPDANRYGVQVSFKSLSRDYGGMLTLSASQIRLIAPPSSRSDSREAKTAHPIEWTQYSGTYRFDDVTHYATSQPGQIESTMTFVFDARDISPNIPQYIQIRGTRFRLPRPNTPGWVEVDASQLGSSGTPATQQTQISANAISIQEAVRQTNDIRPVTSSINTKPSGIQVEERYIAGGDGIFTRGGDMIISRNLRLEGILEPTGTRIVQVDVSRGTSLADIYGPVRQQVGEDARPILVDTLGRTYPPIGFIHEMPDGKTRIKVDFERQIQAGDIPVLPSAGTHKLRMLYAVTEGATIVGFKLGDATIGTCNLLVKDPKQ